MTVVTVAEEQKELQPTDTEKVDDNIAQVTEQASIIMHSNDEIRRNENMLDRLGNGEEASMELWGYYDDENPIKLHLRSHPKLFAAIREALKKDIDFNKCQILIARNKIKLLAEEV